MNKVTLAIMIASISTVVIAPDSKAQGFKVDPGLEQVKPYKHKRIIYIEDPTPQVIDRRRPKPAPTKYLIQVPNLPTAQEKTVVIQAPQGSNGQGSFIVTDGTPPPTGFRSNMNSLKRPVGLPQAKMGGVPNAMSKRAVTGKMKTKPERGLLIKPKRNDQVLNYDDSSRLSTSQSAKTTIKVNAKRIPKFERGSIINSK